MTSAGRSLTIIIILIGIVQFNCVVAKREGLKFYLLRKCQRSTQKVVGLGNSKNSSDCESLVRASRGLAFNFSPLERGTKDLSKTTEKPGNGKLSPRKSAPHDILQQPEEFYNCIALQCPENMSLISMVNDSRFDYYSLYTDPPPPNNATCINGIGVFQFFPNLTDYSTAVATCSTIAQGALAHVVSEARTHAISNLLKAFYGSNHRIKLAYVGLSLSSSKDGSEYVTSDFESLECFLYRAWAPGHPNRKSNYSCVAITMENSWVTVDCQRKLPFICEIYTSGPMQVDVSNFNCPVSYD